MIFSKIKLLNSNQGFKKYLFNTSWLFGTQGIRLFLGLFIGLWVARYLGPEQFGIYNYVISIAGIFLSLATFGIDETLVKEFHEQSASQSTILSTSFYLRLTFGLLFYLLLILFLLLINELNSIKYYILINSLVLFFQPFEVIDSFNRSQVKIKRSSIAKISQLIISSLLKVILILNQSDLIWFVLVGAFDYATYGIFIYYSYTRNEKGFLKARVQIPLAKKLIYKSWPLMLVSVSTIVFLKIDQIIIAKILGKVETGLYASASKVLELTTLFPSLLVLSLFTAILNAKKQNARSYQLRIKHIQRIIFWGCSLISVTCYFFSNQIILLLYGYEYSEGANFLKIICFNLPFIGLSQLTMRWYIMENLQNILVYKSIGACLFSIIINIFLISNMGAIGAAISSLITHFIFYFLFEAFIPKTRIYFKDQIHSIFST